MTGSRAELLPADPRSAGKARRFLRDTLSDWDLPDLVDVAVLLVSEVVTNAILHAGTEMEVRANVDSSRLRIEVLDGFAATPAQRHYEAEAPTGRGLALVDALAAAWGVEALAAGKTVWFELDRDGADGARHRGTAQPHRRTEERPSSSDRYRNVRLLGVPVTLLWATIQYGEAMVREAALIAMAEAEDGGSGDGWRAPAFDLTPLVDQVKAALDAGHDAVDLTVAFPAGSDDLALRRLALVDEADRMAHEGVLLGPPALPEVAACRRWFLSQVTRQLQGDPPIPWRLPDTQDSRVALALDRYQREAIGPLTTASILADDTNHIVFVNDQAAELLGWTVADLTGRRLTVIIPPSLREAHLAGYTRYQVTRETSVIGRAVTVSALRRDGTEIPVELRISVLGNAPRESFLAQLRPLPLDHPDPVSPG